MSKANILVNLKHNAKKAKSQIKGHLKEIDKTKVRPDLRIDDDGNIEKTEASLQKLSRDRMAKIKPVMDKAAKKKVQAQKKILADGGRKGGRGQLSDFAQFGSYDGSRPIKTKSLDVKKADIGDLSADGISSAKDKVRSANQFERQIPRPKDDRGRFSGGQPDPRGLVSKGARPGSLGGTSGGVDASKPRTGKRYRPNKSTKAGMHLGGASENYAVRRRAEGGTRRSGRFGSPKNDQGRAYGPKLEGRSAVSGKQFGPSRPDYGDSYGDKFFGREKDLGRQNLQKATQSVKKLGGSLRNTANNADWNSISLRQMGGQAKRLGGRIRRLIPSMHTWTKLLGAMLPMIITLAVQFAGVAVAIGSVVAAGGALVGLGLIGHGENIADSFGQAKRQINGLKRELFQSFKPALQEFSPISQEFLAKLPQRVEPLVEPLKGLTVFEDTFISLFNGLVSWTGDIVNKLVNYADIVDQIAHRFGSIIGGGLMNGLEWLLDTTYEQQDVMVEVMHVFKSVVGSLWNLIQSVSMLLALLAPLFNVFHKLMKFMNNKWGAIFVSVVAVMYIFIGAITSAAKATFFLNAAMVSASGGAVMNFFTGIQAAIAGLTGYTISAWQAVAATTALVGAMAALTLGGSLLIGGATGAYANNKLSNSEQGIEDSRARTSGRGGGTTINNDIVVNGKDTKEAVRKLEDIDKWHGNSHEDSDNQTEGY